MTAPNIPARPSQNTRDYHRQQASNALDRAQAVAGQHDQLVEQRRALLLNTGEVDTELLDTSIEDARVDIDVELRFAQIQATLALTASPVIMPGQG